MFGYVRPFKGEMLVKEYDAYKGVYCQLCRALGKYYGFPMRLTLSYDCTLYALLALNQRDADVKAEKKRCCCNPMKKCTYVCPANEDVFAEEAFHKAAALSIIMTVHKLRDTAADEDGLKAFGARVLRLFARALDLHYGCGGRSHGRPFAAEIQPVYSKAGTGKLARVTFIARRTQKGRRRVQCGIKRLACTAAAGGEPIAERQIYPNFGEYF